jgi:integral membrane sensor domain MASE1
MNFLSLLILLGQNSINAGTPIQSEDMTGYFMTLIVICVCIFVMNIGIIVSLARSTKMTKQLYESLKRPQ